MKAFHSFWSLPNSYRNSGVISYPDFEIFTSILSALEWKKHNGSIRLITDSQGAEYFNRLGLESIWDSVDTALDNMDSSVDPLLFWAAGKLYALKMMDMPCVMLDTDLIIWKNIDDLLNQDIVCAHAEELMPWVYPDPHKFNYKNGYSLPDEWDYTLKASNTAFLYIRNQEFKDKYVDAALEILGSIRMTEVNTVTGMCFAEQRVLSMIAKAEGKNIGYLMDGYRLNDQEFVTHTWGYKDILRSNPQANEEFCIRCARRIINDFPEMEGILRRCEKTRRYSVQE